VKPLLEKMGIDHEKAWAEFEAAVEKLRSGEKPYMTWEDADA
jgi:heterodisulfide reductase subunit B